MSQEQLNRPASSALACALTAAAVQTPQPAPVSPIQGSVPVITSDPSANAVETAPGLAAPTLTDAEHVDPSGIVARSSLGVTGLVPTTPTVDTDPNSLAYRSKRSARRVSRQMSVQRLRLSVPYVPCSY